MRIYLGEGNLEKMWGNTTVTLLYPQLYSKKVGWIGTAQAMSIKATKAKSIDGIILAKYAHLDPQLQSQAAAFATTASHFSLSPPSAYRGSAKGMKKDSGAPPSASQGGAGSGGHGGYIHLSDTRAPPDYGRIAYPEDIFGSLEVSACGEFVAGDEGKQPGNWQESGSYRIVTREGIFGLTDFLRGKLVEVLMEEERKIKGGS
ncbi:hypothetical protein NHQ30_007565 [Ciborinia camelliae]|nr:hypothetical protein NHQ30_007565 [Ciborinia camelliae]